MAGIFKAIFSVDMFNEGVDIPEVDMVLFLRPTESPTVFLQQLGRGFRKSEGKKFLNVLDFIGNYEKAGRVRFLLTDQNLPKKEQFIQEYQDGDTEDCLINFDMRLIDLFSEMDKKTLRVKEQIRGEFFRIKYIREADVIF